MHSWGWKGVSILSILILLPSLAQAHKDDYLNETFVFQTLDRHEAELEYWFDYHDMTGAGAGHYQHTLSTEYGITDCWMADVALNFSNLREAQSYELSRWRAETRRRFGEEGSRTPDLAVSLELEGERGDDRWDYQITPRLVLSHDFKEQLNTTVNLFLGVGLNSGSDVAPGYNLGIRYPGEGVFRVGGEIIQIFDGRTNSLLIPQVWILPWPEGVFKLGYAKVYGSDERSFVRAAFELGI